LAIKLLRKRKKPDSPPYYTINFHANTVRDDFDRWTTINSQILEGSQPKKLDEIEILGAQGTCLKTFTFSHDYFESNSDGFVTGFLDEAPTFPTGVTPPDRKRLRLLGFHEITCDNSDTLSHSFEYYGQIPRRRSHSQDYWGFNNGKTSNSRFVPALSQSEIPFSHPGGYPCDTWDDLADRESAEDPMKKGVLEKITYPTGGSSDFEYEANNIHVVVDQTLTEYISDASNCTHPYDINCDTVHSTEATDVVYTPQSPTDVFKLVLTMRRAADFGTNPPEMYQGDIYADFFIKDSTGQTVFNDYLELPDGEDLAVFEYVLPDGIAAVQPHRTYDYLFEKESGSGGWPSVKLSIQIKREYTTPVDKQITVGGLRIKKITNDPIIGAPVVRQFNYADHEGNSTGRLVDFPRFLSIFPIGAGYYQVNSNDCDPVNAEFSSSPVVGLSSINGSHIGYKQVTVSTEGAANGYSQYQYKAYPGPLFYWTDFPNVPVRPPGLLYGNLDREQHFDESGSLIKQTKYLYDVIQDPWAIEAWGFGRYPNCTSGKPPQIFSPAYQNYHLPSGRLLMIKKIETIDGVTNTTAYTYESQGVHLNPLSEEMTNSDGKVYRTEYEYINEVGLSYPGAFCMDKRYMIGIPLITKNFVDGVQVSGTKVEYDCTYLKPEKLYIYWGGWVEKANAVYGTDGNPTSLTDVLCSDNNQSYTWTNDLLTARSWNTWNWTYGYESNSRLLNSLTDHHGIVTTVSYDKFLRLQTQNERNGQIITNYDYVYSLPAGGTPNQIIAKIDYSDVPSRTTIQHLDGLGRPLVTMKKDYSPDQEDVGMQGITYDAAGRPYKNFLPYISANSGGAYSAPVGSSTETIFEPSPLNRPSIQIHPDFTQIKTSYGCNSSQDAVSNYSNDPPTTYLSCSLFKTTVWDENNHRTITFTDKVGRTVLVRRFTECNDQGENCQTTLDTYYGYDDKGNLIKVVTPEGQNYTYTYDARNRMLTKSIPGGAGFTFTYNDCDDMVTSSDGNYSFSYTYDSHRQQLTTSVGGSQVLENEYDKDRLTKVHADVLNPDGTYGSTLTTEYKYDQYGRIYQTISPSMIGSDQISNIYLSDDNILKTTRDHVGHESITIEQTHDFDHWGRQTETWHQLINGDDYSPPVLINELGYNFRDELVRKHLHSSNGGASFLQRLGYGYTVRGWLTNINGVSPPLVNQGPKGNGCSGFPDVVQTETESTVSVDIAQLLEWMSDGTDIEIEGVPCTPVDPPTGTACDYTCSSEELAAQNTSRQTLESAMDDILSGATSIQFPTTLYLVEYCDGTTQYVLEQELSLIDGTFFILQEILLEGFYHFTFDVLFDGQIVQLGLRDILIRRIEEEFEILGLDCSAVSQSDTTNCWYVIDQENWSYSLLPGTRQVLATYDQVVNAYCGGDSTELLQLSGQVYATSQKKNTLRTDSSLVLQDSGYIHQLVLASWVNSTADSLIIDLSPSAVATYGLSGVLDSTDLIFDADNPFVMASAVEVVIHSAIEDWRATDSLASVQYELEVEVLSTGYAAISFYIYHNPSTPFVGIDPASSRLAYYPEGSGGSLIQGSSRSQGTATVQMPSVYQAPCGSIGLQYNDMAIDTSSTEWHSLTLNTPAPVLDIKFPENDSLNCPQINSYFTSDCTTRIQVCDDGICTDCLGNPIGPDCDSLEQLIQQDSVGSWRGFISGMTPI
jgi:YD repeat-containing protein